RSGLDLARDNLANLNLPAGQRHGAWAYSLMHWLPRARVEALVNEARKNAKSNKAEVARMLQAYLARYPDIEQLVPLLLDRADPAAAEFVLVLAGGARTPALLAAVRDFAMGQRGSDELRMKAAQKALEHGLQPAGQIRMWMQGKQQDVLLLNTEITSEVEPDFMPDKAMRLADKGRIEMMEGDPVVAERYMLSALEIAPNHPSLLNNLGQCYMLQGRKAEFEALMQQISAAHPDYFFGIAHRARKLIEQGDKAGARDLLNGLLQRRKMHPSEIAMACTVEIEFGIKFDQVESAKMWLETFEKVYPNHPNIETMRRRLFPPDFRELLRRSLQGGR
ncbi:MAG: tetratricopeptide repeat protein, partial [Blastocatellia bacterium]